MTRIVIADPEQVEGVYRESYALWGGGLSYEGYLELWRDLRATPWGRENLSFWVLVGENGAVLSSLKCYRLGFQVDGRRVPGIVIGALFTPVRSRRRGHARNLLDEILVRATADGSSLALLFSDVGHTYYERSGFRPLAANDAFGRIPRGPRQPPEGWRLDVMTREHRSAVAAARAATASRARFALARDQALWEFLRARSRGFFDRYRDGDVRQRCRVVLRGGAFAGYVVAVEGRGEWAVRELGAADGLVDTEASILRAAGSLAAAAGNRRVHGWLQEDLTVRIPDWKWSRSPRRRAVPMIADLDGHLPIADLCRPGAADLTFLDQF